MTPLLVACCALESVGSGLLSTWTVSTNYKTWIPFEVVRRRLDRARLTVAAVRRRKWRCLAASVRDSADARSLTRIATSRARLR